MDYFQNQREPPNHFKYLLRSVTIDSSDHQKLKKICLKRLHLKHINNSSSTNQDDPSPKLNFHRYLKRNTLKNLQKTQIHYIRKLNWLNDLKNAKSLRIIQLRTCSEDIKRIPGFKDTCSKINNILQCIKKFPKNINTVSIQMEGLSIEKGHLEKIYRILSSFKKLERAKRQFGFEGLESYIRKDYLLTKRYMKRCSKLKEFNYDPIRTCWSEFPMEGFPINGDKDQRELEKLMREGKKFPFITHLYLPIMGGFLQEGIEDECVVVKEENSNDENEPEENKEAELKKIFNSLFLEKSILMKRNNISPFFKFELFPKLKMLVLDLKDNIFTQVNSSVVKSFSHLKELKHFELILPQRPSGAKFFFEGFLQLPSLSHFSLTISFIKSNEWELFFRFLSNQSQLAAFKLKIEKYRTSHSAYLVQEKYIQRIGNYLQKKHKLTHIDLALAFTSLTSISALLQQISMRNQVKVLNIQAFDISLTDSTAGLGLCKFIESQQYSLKHLSLQIHFIVNQYIMENICKAIAKLRELKTLELYINFLYEEEKLDYDRFFQETLRITHPIKLLPRVQTHETWYSHLSKMVQKGPSLSRFDVCIGRLTGFDDKFVKEFIGIIKNLSFLKALRSMILNIPFAKFSGAAKDQIKKAILGMKNIKELTIGLEDVGSLVDSQELAELVARLNNRQALKTELMF